MNYIEMITTNWQASSSSKVCGPLASRTHANPDTHPSGTPAHAGGMYEAGAATGGTADPPPWPPAPCPAASPCSGCGRGPAGAPPTPPLGLRAGGGIIMEPPTCILCGKVRKSKGAEAGDKHTERAQKTRASARNRSAIELNPWWPPQNLAAK